MRLERLHIVDLNQEIAVNPDHVVLVRPATDNKGLPVLGSCFVQLANAQLLIKGAVGEIAQQLEGKHPHKT